MPAGSPPTSRRVGIAVDARFATVMSPGHVRLMRYGAGSPSIATLRCSCAVWSTPDVSCGKATVDMTGQSTMSTSAKNASHAAAIRAWASIRANHSRAVSRAARPMRVPNVRSSAVASGSRTRNAS